MTDPIARMWNIRDAVLLWLYTESAADGHASAVNLDALHECTSWQAEPIDAREANRAMAFLIDQGLAKGTIAMGGHVLRPAITSAGEMQAATGLSVKPGPPKEANTTGVTHNYNITTHGSANVAVNSTRVSQTITIDQKTEKILEVADALEAHAESGPANADEARRIAADLREAAAEPEENKSKLLSYLGSAVGAFTLAAGTTAGQHATQLAVEALQSLA